MHAYRMLIDGEWVEARSGRTLEVMNPATAEPIRHQIRRHPHPVCRDASVHEASGEGRLAGPRGPDELDDHRGRAMRPADGATSR